MQVIHAASTYLLREVKRSTSRSFSQVGQGFLRHESLTKPDLWEKVAKETVLRYFGAIVLLRAMTYLFYACCLLVLCSSA